MTRISIFSPTTTEIPAGAPLESAGWNVTVPQSAEIVQPPVQLLEQLLPTKRRPLSMPIAKIFEELFGPMEHPMARPGDAYAKALKAHQNRARTQNGAQAYHSSGSAVLDAFSGLNGNSTTQQIHRELAASWSQSPELTLRIIWNIRSIHEGQNNKHGFYHAFGWLYKNHPRTAIENLIYIVEPLCQRPIKRWRKNQRTGVNELELMDAPEFPDEETAQMSHGYYKDLLNILVLAMRNELGDPNVHVFNPLNAPRPEAQHRKRSQWERIKETKKKQNEALGLEAAKKHRAEISKEADEARAKQARAERETRREADFTLLESKLKNDKSFLALYTTVAHIFAEVLANDTAVLKRIENSSEDEAFSLQFELTYASKWAPTIEGFHDRMTNISTAIALILHARGHMADLPLVLSQRLTQEEAHILRSYYRRWIISPLRRFLDITEVKMSSQKWHEIKYPRVSAECMKSNKSSFFKHDEKQFANYLEDVEAGQARISGGTLLPHELLVEALRMKDVPVPKLVRKDGKRLKSKAIIDMEVARRLAESNRKVIDAQWRSIVERLRESGELRNSLAIVDVSGSMGSIHSPPSPDQPKSSISPIFPAVALGIVLAQLAQPPFDNMFITFSSKPELLTVQPGGLAEQAHWMATTNWSMNTDYEAVFLKLLLPVAIENRVKPEDMVKRLFVFSDMQFDQSLSNRTTTGWQTSHDRVVQAYEKAGYEPPQIVYWNLQGGRTKPVLQDTPGTSLLTGFSANMMKLFMEGGNLENELSTRKSRDSPITVMQRALSKACYDTLKVYD